MSSEERIIRPYEGVERISRVLDDAYVQMSPQHRIDAGQTKRLVASEFLAFPVQLWLGKDEAALDAMRDELGLGVKEAGLQLGDVALLVVLSSPRLKLVEMSWHRKGDELDDLRPHLDLVGESRPAPLRTPFGGCRIDVYVLLAEHLEEAPLRPWRKGTWLAHTRFEIKTDLGDIGFTPLPLTADKRDQFGLPAGTIRHAVVEDPFAEASGADAVLLYVDEELLNQLALQPSLAAAKAFQRQLFIDAMSAVIHSASKSQELETKALGDLEGTVIGRLIDRLAGASSDRTAEEHRHRSEELMKDVREQPAKVIGWVEAIVPGLRTGMVDLLRGESL